MSDKRPHTDDLTRGLETALDEVDRVERGSGLVTTTIIGTPFADDTVRGVAYALQQATTWHLRRPSV